jgi:hypothetical protein
MEASEPITNDEFSEEQLQQMYQNYESKIKELQLSRGWPRGKCRRYLDSCSKRNMKKIKRMASKKKVKKDIPKKKSGFSEQVGPSISYSGYSSYNSEEEIINVEN